MTSTKQTVYLPSKTCTVSDELIVIPGGTRLQGTIGYFFTVQELNNYTENVIKQALENAAFESRTKFIPFTDNEEEVDKQSILNTFEQTFNKFKV